MLSSTQLWDIPNENKCFIVVPEFLQRWKKYTTSDRCGKGSSLLWSVVGTSSWRFISAACLRLILCFTEFINPVFVMFFIEWIEYQGSFMWTGYMLCVVLLFANLIHSILTQLYYKFAAITAMRTRTALTAALYQKTLNMSPNTNSKECYSLSQVLNLMSADTEKIHNMFSDIHEIWSEPIMIVISFVYLWYLIGASCLAGLALIILLSPINSGYLIHECFTMHDVQTKYKNERIRLVTEAVNCIKFIKLYLWESSFRSRIEDMRTKELNMTRKHGYLNSGIGVIWYCTSYLVSLVMFSVYVLSSKENVLTPKIAFVSIVLINILNWCASFIPICITLANQSFASLNKVAKVLYEEEENDDFPVRNTTNPITAAVMSVRGGNFSWSTETQTLTDFNIDVGKGQLIGIVGESRSGKTSLLHAILGEIPRLSGVVNVQESIAYVPQEAWLQKGTLRSNVLFNRAMSIHRYENVMKACDLNKDQYNLPDGDKTKIANGASLTVSQTQRVNLARAVYQNEDIYLLDEPLAGLNHNMARNIYENVISNKGLLKQKTRLWVTQQVPLLAGCDIILVLSGGKVVEAGTFNNLIHHDGALSRLVSQGFQDGEENTGALKKLRASSMKRLEHFNSHSADSSSSTKDTSSAEEVPLQLGRRRRKLFSRSIKLDRSSKDKILEEIEDENKVTSAPKVHWSSVWLYVKANSVMAAIFVIFLALAYTSALVLTNLWLRAWTDDLMPEPYNRLGIYAVFGIIQVTLVLGLSLVVYMGGVNAAAALHDKLLQSVFSASAVFFSRTPIGCIVRRFHIDTDKVDSNIPQFFRLWLFNLVFMVSVVITICYVLHIFIIFIIPLLGVYILLQNIYSRYISQLKRMESMSRSIIQNHFTETQKGRVSIRAFGRKKHFVATCDRLVDERHIVWYPIIIGQRWLGIYLDLLGNILIFVVAILVVIHNESLTSGTVGLVLAFVMQTSWVLNMMIRGSCEMECQMVSVKRITEFGDLPPEGAMTVPQNTPDSLWPLEGRVEFRNYSARYSQELDLVLDNLSFQVKPREKFAIVGRKGAGKSTVVMAVSRLMEPVGGAVYIDGVNISQIGLIDLRQKLAVIPQEPSLFHGSIRYNMDPLGEYRDRELWLALERAHLMSFLSQHPDGLEYDCGEDGHNLSIGQRQLLCLARAIMRDSQILILDECPGHVDTETEALILNTIHSEFRHATVIIATHRITTAISCDRACVLEDGKLKELASPGHLLDTPDTIFSAMAAEEGIK